MHRPGSVFDPMLPFDLYHGTPDSAPDAPIGIFVHVLEKESVFHLF